VSWRAPVAPRTPGRGVRSRLRRFAAVGVLVTAVDVAVLLGLRLGTGMPVLGANAVAIALAVSASFAANRALSSTHDPHLRFVEVPSAYAAIAVVAGIVDVVVLRLVVTTVDSMTVRGLLTAKAVSLSVAGIVRVVGYRRLLFRRVRAALNHPEPGRPTAPGDRRLSVVIPAWCAESTIAATLTRLRAELTPAVGEADLEIVVVDDGSPDGTAAAAVAAGADNVVRLPENRGKGAAVRAGVLAARGRAIAFTDADLAYEPRLLLRLLEQVEAGWDVVVGSRRHVETVTLVRTRRLREITGRIFNLISFAVLLGAYRDTQCGLKAFRSDAARRIFGVAQIDRFAFDVEIFHLAERYQLALSEVPVTIDDPGNSSVRVGPDSLRMLLDLVRIRQFAGQGAYDEVSEPATLH